MTQTPDLTPQPASSSFVYSEAADTVTNRFGQLYPKSVTSSVSLGVTSASLAVVSSTVLSKTTYSSQNVTLTTVNVSNLAGTQYTISKVVFSAPIVVKSFSQSFQVVSTNITVFGAANTATQLTSDKVAQVVAVVSDSTI